MFCVALTAMSAVRAEDACVESTGAQAVILDYYANPRTRVLVDFAYTDITTQQRVFGSTIDNSCHYNFGSYISG